jgi:DNA polymerase-3 subunit epsilon
MDEFIGSHFPTDEKIVLGGHNINFDVNFLSAFLTRNGYNFQQRFSHRTVDTSAILFYLYLTGKLKRKLTASQDALDYFGIVVQGRHTALGDAVATAQLFSRLVDILYRGTKGRSSSPKDMSDLFAPPTDGL